MSSNRPEPFTADELRHMREYLEYQQTPITLRDINDKLDALMTEEQDQRDKLDQRVEVMWSHMFPDDHLDRRSDRLEQAVRDGVRGLLADLRKDQWVDKATFDQLINEGETRLGGTRYLRITDDDAVVVPQEESEMLHRLRHLPFGSLDDVPAGLLTQVWDIKGDVWVYAPIGSDSHSPKYLQWKHGGLRATRAQASSRRGTNLDGCGPFFATAEGYRAVALKGGALNTAADGDEG